MRKSPKGAPSNYMLQQTGATKSSGCAQASGIARSSSRTWTGKPLQLNMGVRCPPCFTDVRRGLMSLPRCLLLVAMVGAVTSCAAPASERAASTGARRSVFEELAVVQADTSLALIVGKRSHHPEDQVRSPMLARLASVLEAADPEWEARRALGSGDRRLLAVQGYALHAPGVPGSTEHLRQAGRLRTLAHTSDSWLSEDEARYNRAAARFAHGYNCALLRLLAEPSECP